MSTDLQNLFTESYLYGRDTFTETFRFIAYFAKAVDTLPKDCFKQTDVDLVLNVDMGRDNNEIVWRQALSVDA